MKRFSDHIFVHNRWLVCVDLVGLQVCVNNPSESAVVLMGHAYSVAMSVQAGKTKCVWVRFSKTILQSSAGSLDMGIISHFISSFRTYVVKMRLCRSIPMKCMASCLFVFVLQTKQEATFNEIVSKGYRISASSQQSGTLRGSQLLPRPRRMPR